MKGKNLCKKIVASVLMLAIVFSNVSVAADTHASESQTEASEDMAAQTATTSADDSETDSQDEPQISDTEEAANTTSPDEAQPPADITEGEGDASVLEPSEGETENNESDASSEDNSSDISNEEDSSNTGNNDENISTDTSDGDNSGDISEDRDASDSASNAEDSSNSTESEGNDSADGSDNTQITEDVTTDETSSDTSEEKNPSNSEEGNTGVSSEQPPVDDSVTSDVPAVEENTETSDAEQTEEEQPKEIEAIDFEGLISLEELTALDDETVDATMWENIAPRRARRRASDAGGSSPSYSFDAYYVNQDNRYEVTKTNNFHLKYQMEFHASANLPAGSVEICISGKLLDKRDGSPLWWSEIAVPKGEDTENFTYNRRTPFNYREEGEDIVFFNYRDIPSGTNAAWQILYKNVTLMEIRDNTPWTLTPTVTVDLEGKEETSQEYQPLTGLIDSSVSLSSVTKIPYIQSGSNYTPGLYTTTQIEHFIDGKVPTAYRENYDPEGRLNTTDYHYVVWEVKARGTATQPWNLSLVDTPVAGENIPGFVVGYKDNSSKSLGYNLPIEEPTLAEEETTNPPTYNTASSQDVRVENWSSRFYVVTAYPAEHAKAGQKVENNITFTLDPIDAIDEDITMTSSSANWEYEDYNWSYKGKILDIDKTTDRTKYTGWLDAYRKASQENPPKDYGDMPFSTTAGMYGYSATHITEGDGIGNYIPGSYYTMTTADDVMYAHFPSADSQKQHRMLSGRDYYFSGVTIQQTDYGYDIWEDKTADSEWTALEDERPQGIDNKVRIYAMFTEEYPEKIAEAIEEGYIKEASNGWMQLVIEGENLTLDASGTMEPYELDAKYLDLHPYRIKVEHDSVDFRSECEIDVNVRMRHDSPVMAEIVAARAELDDKTASQEVEIENLAGVMGVSYSPSTEDGNMLEIHYGYGDNYSQYEKYAEAQYGDTNAKTLKEVRKELYGEMKDNELPHFDNASRVLTWLTRTSKATKTSKTTNDVDNNRGLVEYTLTAYDGYDIYDRECLNYLYPEEEENLSPGRSHVVFYDLLPYGMNFDASYPVTVGRVTDLSNAKYTEQPGLWNKTQVSITVEATDIESNYRGTGRTRVAFHIAYDGAEMTSYTMGKWIEGWGVHFRAYYDWKDLDVVNERYKGTEAYINSNICAFMPDFSDRSGGSNDGKWELYGLNDEVFCDNGELPGGLNNVYADMVKASEEGAAPGNIDRWNQEIIVTDKDGTEKASSVDEEFPNILYAYHPLDDDITVAAESRIDTLVRADDDRLGTFHESADVEANKDYTYSISVTTAADCENIIIYNNLENGATDRAADDKNDPFKPFDDRPWRGTLKAVDISGLTLLGVTPTVYYRADTIIHRQIENIDTKPTLSKENGWYTETEWKNAGYSMTDVKAIAVAMPDDFTLTSGESISFQVKMQAPAGTDADFDYNAHAYNCASFYSDSDSTAGSIVEGNTARVGITEKTETLEVIKKITGDVPDSRLDEEFEFLIYTTPYGENGKKLPIPFAEYELFEVDREGVWRSQGTRASSEKGYFTLKHNQKAVFTRPGASRVQIEERASVFWDASSSRVTKGDTITETVTNTFRPVLYIQKSLASVPEGKALTTEQKTFTFQIKVKKAGESNYTELADSEYWYVKRADLTGATPDLQEVKGPDGKMTTSGRTDADGKFTLHVGEIIALFPGTTGTEYQVKEVETGEDWICTYSEAADTLPAKGAAKIFTNYYRWKDLYVTKEIEHQEKEDYEQMAESEKLFTFQVFEATLGEDGKPLLDAEKEPIPVYQKDAEGKDTKKLTTAGLRYVLLDGEGEEIEGSEGTLTDNGEFTCALGFGTVKITSSDKNPGLEADKIYIVKELTDRIAKVPNAKGEEVPLYQAIKDADQVQISVFSSRGEATLINDCQRRSLSVSKTVIFGEQKPEEDPVFEFYIEATKETTPKEYTYDVVDAQGNLVVREEGTWETPATYKENLQTRDGVFRLSDGETAVFRNIGMLGDSFQVCEKFDKDYPQIAPAMQEEGTDGAYGEASEVTLAGDNDKVAFINGQEGSLYIGKEYITAEDSGFFLANKYITRICNLVRYSEIMNKEETGSFGIALINDVTDGENLYLEESAVEFYLEVTEGEDTYTWPKKETTVNYINPYTGVSCGVKWMPGGPIKVYPFYLIQIPVGEDTGLSSDTVYTLREAEEYQHRLVDVTRNGCVEVSQCEPVNDQPVTGTISEKMIAKIYNQAVSVSNQSEIRKEMTDYSDEVPVGAKLTWRVEQYNEATQSWFPAEGIPHVVVDCMEMDGYQEIINTPVSDRIERTGSDGKITLVKSENGYPQVRFSENVIYMNLYLKEDIESLLTSVVYQRTGKLLRIVEVPEESDSEWGKLVGYGRRTMSGIQYGLNIKPAQDAKDDQGQLMGKPYGNIFVNSNKTDTVAIKKSMTDGVASPDQQFTMVLEQVVSTNWDEFDISENGNQYIKDWIAETQPRGNIPYIIHKPDGTIAEGTTTAKGEIKLYAGEYATLDLPKGTWWTVSEDLQSVPTYTLDSLTPNPGNSTMRYLDTNLMLIHMQEPELIEYKLIFKDRYEDEELERSFTEYSRAKYFEFPIVKGSEDIFPIAYTNKKFVGWNEQSDGEGRTYRLGDKVSLSADNPSKTLYAIWKEITVTWLNWDGVELDKRPIKESEGVPDASSYKKETPVRLADNEYRYIFSGWSDPAIDEDGNVIYVAQYDPISIGVIDPVDPPVGPIEPIEPIEPVNPTPARTESTLSSKHVTSGKE